MSWFRLRDFPAPYITALLAGLLVVALIAWHRGPEGPHSTVAKVPRTRAKLFDGHCVFAADIELGSTWGRFAFARRYLDVRDALIEVLRTKSRYMVSSRTAREALRTQMVAAVNRVLGNGRATRFEFTEFQLL